jgi:hypothetical protein
MNLDDFVYVHKTEDGTIIFIRESIPPEITDDMLSAIMEKHGIPPDDIKRAIKSIVRGKGANV